jgi:acetyl-CoA carboxylase carboxyl transferase subunit alpha
MAFLDFEKPITEVEKQIQDIRNSLADKAKKPSQHPEISALEEKQIHLLEEKLEALKRTIYASLTPWQRVQIARHPKRPYTSDYISMLFTNFVELHGDRLFADDKALIGGLAEFEGRKVLVMGHQKGRDLKENLARNFGCAHPEGYRKALRFMQLAEKFGLPVLVFIDTPGAYPGIGAEERGQAQAIAFNLREMISIAVPIIATVIGEGGSGGALGVGVADRIFVMENAYYSVISPEGCASILWKNSIKASTAAEVLKLTGADLLKLGIIDEIIPEPLGGAHHDPKKTADSLKASLKAGLKELSSLGAEELLAQRYMKFRKMGVFTE